MSHSPSPVVETADLAPPPGAVGSGYARIKALFNAVCDLPDEAAQRAALDAAGATAAETDKVLALLGHRGEATRFARPVAQAAAQWLDNELVPGDRLGAWTLAREMGRGGMGRVFEAQRFVAVVSFELEVEHDLYDDAATLTDELARLGIVHDPLNLADLFATDEETPNTDSPTSPAIGYAELDDAAPDPVVEE